MYLFFYQSTHPQTGFLSQWFRSTIKEEGISFNCVEQYMMYKKAKLFGDENIAQQILNTTQPITQRKLGRKVKNFKKKIWNKHKYDIVKKGNRLKFEQNIDLKRKLLETSGKYLVESSPTDKIWGIGLSMKDPLICNPDNWGENLLGHILVELRQDFINAQ